MKTIFFSILVTSAVAFFSPVQAQLTPAGAGDKDLRDNNIRMRSAEMERVKREAAKVDSPSFAALNTEIDLKFPQIKEDFEGMQLSQEAIIKAYTTGEKINYATIELAAESINKNAKRLDSNLFAAKADNKEEKTKENEAVNLKKLIVELDNVIGRLVASKMFLNLKVVDPDVARRTRIDLVTMMELTEKLAKEAKSLK